MPGLRSLVICAEMSLADSRHYLDVHYLFTGGAEPKFFAAESELRFRALWRARCRSIDCWRWRENEGKV